MSVPVRAQRSELVDHERLAAAVGPAAIVVQGMLAAAPIEADARLLEEHRAARRELDAERDGRRQGRCQEQADSGDGNTQPAAQQLRRLGRGARTAECLTESDARHEGGPYAGGMPSDERRKC